MASMKKQGKVRVQGEHESLICEGGEEDLHKHFSQCTKHPGHKEFLPLDSLSKEHLPKEFHDKDTFELIKAVANLTVRIDVRKTSPERPEYWPNSLFTSYPFYNNIGSDRLRIGSGWIRSVFQYPDKDNDLEDELETCPCRTCKRSRKPREQWWKINVDTVAHLVFDKVEANETNISMFYDKEDSPDVVILEDIIDIADIDVESDWCTLYFATCDKTLASRLTEMNKKYYELFHRVLKKHKFRDDRKLMFIVSHPHGGPKQVSVGTWEKRINIDKRLSQFTYKTSTCPGSSGGYVQCMGYGEVIHSGVNERHGINYSTIGHVL